MGNPFAIQISMRQAIVVISLSVVVGACAGRPVQVPVGTPRPVASSAATILQGTTPPTASVTPTASPRPSIDLVAGSWTLETVLPGFEVRDLAAGSDAIIAVGCQLPVGETACAGAAIETSTDGVWAPARLDGKTNLVELVAVAAGGASFVAVGREFSSEEGGNATAVAFTSSDGRMWRRAPDQASLHGRTFSDVVARPGGGWLAVGAEVLPTVFMGIDTWTSSDGLRWTLVDAMPHVGMPSGVTTFKDGFITWGTDCLDVCGPPARAALWRSRDGKAWERIPDQPALAHGQVYEVIETSTGALAVGATFDDQGNATGMAWLTVDGATWEKIALPGGSGHQSFKVTSTADAYVTVGARACDTGSVWSTWTSPDAATWTRLPDDDACTGSLEIVASNPGVIGVVGSAPPALNASSVLRLGMD